MSIRPRAVSASKASGTGTLRPARGAAIAVAVGLVIAGGNSHGALAAQTLPPRAPPRSQADSTADATPPARLPAAVLAEVAIEGNTTIDEPEIRRKISSQPGRPPDPKTIEDDVRRLYATRWFAAVEPQVRDTPRGKVLVFRLTERPIVKEVRYLGNKAVKTKDLEALTGLRPGSPMDPALNLEARRRIEEHYRQRGRSLASVELLEGNQPTDRRVVFQVTEGEKVQITGVRFRGNTFAGGPLLATKILTKPRRFVFFGGRYDPQSIDDDVGRLEAYYTGLGFFDVQVRAEREFSENRSKLRVTFFIDEGKRYQVRNIAVAGNRRLDEATLLKDSALKPGDYFSQYKLQADVRRMQAAYGALGHYYAEVNAEPRFYREEGILDLVYGIKEDEPYRVRNVEVRIKGDNPRTMERVVRARLPIRPGDLLDPAKLRRAEQNLRNSQLFRVDPAQGIAPRIEVVEPLLAQRSPIVRAQYQEEEPPGAPGPNFLDEPPPSFLDQPGPGERDFIVDLEEAPTGRFMVGAGIDSNNGVLGSIVFDERNFDIARPPRSLNDFLDGTAFRGAGQELRVEALPGNRVSRYMVNFREPYLFDLPLSFGVGGYYFERLYRDWDEERLGGRFSLGHAFTDEIAGNVSLRLENVEISNPDVPTPPDLTRVLGDSFLGTARFALAHDTRDSPFLPTEGHFVELAYEQGFGDFTFPRGTLEGRQYFTMRQRPDGTGRQVLGLRGLGGITGSNTPIFDRFFAGGFQTLRGFDYRGATPRVFDVRVGGEFELLCSAEYQFPLTADDTLQAVAFVDFGTVEESVKIEWEDFRVSLGAGLRITLPAMGPVPIALDLAVPIAHEDGDDIENFSFWIGFLR
ncbi:MAG: BamA/TamA family outer membrane protein [Planctomycetes bacterium]|nr:BamA/TamA family outer membrane protein [Planctomycetota bacterium]